jgi:hypothetical protein
MSDPELIASPASIDVMMSFISLGSWGFEGLAFLAPAIARKQAPELLGLKKDGKLQVETIPP